MDTSIGVLQKILITLSDISAIGSPQRMLSVLLTIVACVFITAFGVGVWLASDQLLLIRIISVLIIGNAIFGVIATLFFPNRN